MTEPQSRDIKDLTLAEVATSRRLIVAIGVLLVIAVVALAFLLVRDGDDTAPGTEPGGRACDNSAAVSCDDFRRPTGGG